MFWSYQNGKMSKRVDIGTLDSGFLILNFNLAQINLKLTRATKMIVNVNIS
jgi:hypothetical protein